MSNLPLKALKWIQKNLNPLAEPALTAYSALHEYVITEPKQGKFELKKTRLSRPDKKSEFLPYFDTVTEAQDWAWKHYNEKMQPYVVPYPTKVYELAFDYGDGYFTVFMTADKQAALDFIESVKKHDEQFICDTGYDTYEYESINDEYDDNHPLKPYASKIFESIYEDSFSEYANNYPGESFASQLSIIEHELFVKQGE